ncbi:serine hydrolase [Rhodospira trueperi]|uniref:Beta-lactamase enzyme family protein n=1 Tax=Rhodospira trueperi TaxID=69960 RepID=A0A1G7E0P1_9PROT|nr:serine hydrolase [Rhodospira trueperi]SDE57298.1 Beta-lactamase enzyme family protein [Rhodospira trueperi]
MASRNQSRVAGAFLAFVLLMSPAPGIGGHLSETAAIERLFRDDPIRETWFTPTFRAQLPLFQLSEIVAQLTRDFGPVVSVEVNRGAGVIGLEHATIPVRIKLNARGQIGVLYFGRPAATASNTSEIIDSLSGLGDTVSVFARVDGRERVTRSADERLAVGSAFKLFVLTAYEQAVSRGDIRRDDVVRLAADDLSLPTGVLQTVPVGTPVTLETLAALMIQQSDNTATDALIRVLGRNRVENLSAHNRPFLTTGEAFRLKTDMAADLRRRYATAAEDERREIVKAARSHPIPSVDKLVAGPTWTVEWFASTRELCDLMEALKGSPILAATPAAPVTAEHWAWVGYKGGSEFGVLNFTAAGVRADGTPVCLSVTVNSRAAIPVARGASLFSGLFSTYR